MGNAPGFDTRLRTAMERAGINQSELARRLGIRPQSVQGWVSGESEPRRHRIDQIARVLEVSPRWLRAGGGGTTVMEKPVGYSAKTEAASGSVGAEAAQLVEDMTEAYTRESRGSAWTKAIKREVLRHRPWAEPLFDVEVKIGGYQFRFDFFAPTLVAEWEVKHPIPLAGGKPGMPERVRDAIMRLALVRSIDQGMTPEGLPMQRKHALIILLDPAATGEPSQEQQAQIDQDIRQVEWEAQQFDVTVLFTRSGEEAAKFIVDNVPATLFE